MLPASNALFCVLQVWQDFIHFVVQLLFSRGANFHSSKPTSCRREWGDRTVRTAVVVVAKSIGCPHKFHHIAEQNVFGSARTACLCFSNQYSLLLAYRVALNFCGRLKDQHPVTAHAPNFDFLTGCREFKRREK